VVKQDSASMVREGGDQARLQLRASSRFREGISRAVEVLLRRAVELGPAGRAVSGKEGLVECLGALQPSRPTVERLLTDEDVDPVVKEILGDEDAVVRQSDHQRMFGFSVFEMEELEANAVDEFGARRYDTVGLFSSARNSITMLFMLLGSNPVADRVDLGCHGGQRIDWTRECRRTKDVVRMEMRHVKERGRLAERPRVGHDLTFIRQHVLRIDDDELRRGLYDCDY
jgi:hypothetical protein